MNLHTSMPEIPGIIQDLNQDLNMPDIGGIEVVEFVRSQDHLRDVPIIIDTTRGDDASKEREKERAPRAVHAPEDPRF